MPIGVAHRDTNANTISVARKEAVAALDAFIGPKALKAPLDSCTAPGWRNQADTHGLKSHCAKARAGSNPSPGT